MPPILPIIALAALLAWLLTGLTQVPLDQRAIYERFGAPVSVLHPGLHAGLPWPLATTIMLDDGAIHDIALAPVTTGNAQWPGAKPHILYRTGLADADALRAATTAQPEALVRAFANRIVTQSIAAPPGADRDAMAQTLRTRLQVALDRHATGLEAIAIVIESLRAPEGADDTVAAADIAARTNVAVAHGAAATIAAQARQSAYDTTSAAHAAAAENVALARADLVRFSADRQAARAGGQSFLLERYFTALATALAHAPKTIIDHRLNWPEAPVLDLRPYAAAADAGTGKQE